MRKDVVHSQTALPTRWNKNDDRLGRGVFADGEICGLGHGDHQGGEVGDLERLEVDVHIEWSGTVNVSVLRLSVKDGMRIPRREVEDGVRGCTHPLSQIASFSQGNTTSHNTRLDLSLRRHVTRS